MLDKGQRLVYNKGWRGGHKKDLKTQHIVCCINVTAAWRRGTGRPAGAGSEARVPVTCCKLE